LAEGRRAALVDRDGTIIREREYLSDPAGVELLPGAAEGLRALQSAGYAIVIVTNQSGIARGLYDESAYAAVEAEVERRLAEAGVHVLGSYHCPHHPDFSGPCDCRKPAPGLALRAAREHDLDLGRSAFIGDRVRDVAMATALGGIPVLVRSGYGRAEEVGAPGDVRVVDTLAEAADLLTGAGRGR
jgi:D-glycero-D-manno-heptose 1,7-bisphosphate phosphatase